MSINPKHNKDQIKNLIRRYLKGDFHDVSQLEQYNTPKNQKWLRDNLTQDQARIWLSENARRFDTSTETEKNYTSHITQQRISHHHEVAVSKIHSINQLGFAFITEFQDTGSLIKYYNLTIKKFENEIQMKDTDNLYADLRFQIESINQLKKQR
jgi:hypothetical protein